MSDCEIAHKKKSLNAHLWHTNIDAFRLFLRNDVIGMRLYVFGVCVRVWPFIYKETSKGSSYNFYFVSNILYLFFDNEYEFRDDEK